MAEERRHLVVGLSLPQDQPDVTKVLQTARDDGYEYVTTELPNPGDLRMDVTALESRWWRTSVVGTVTLSEDSMKEEDDIDAQMPFNAELLRKKIEWASHMNIPAVILPFSPSVDYARLVSSVALTAAGSSGQIWIKTALTAEALAAFDVLHRRCDGASHVGMLLYVDHVPAVEPALVGSIMTLVHKAIGCNLKAICFPTHVFLTNKRGYPALSKTHQVLFTEILRRVGRTVRVLLEGEPVHDIPAPPAGETVDPKGATGCLPYLQYIRHLRCRQEVSQMLDTPEAAQEEQYLDHLQRPLDPLGDHLEFSTYETFEKDPVKYRQYQHALVEAIEDGLANNSFHKVVTIMVAGAGRGPLVKSAINAVKEVNDSAPNNFVVPRIFALEKNPSAALYLKSMARRDVNWVEIVTVLECDMRDAQKYCERQVDIVVSELLGSFGDNELSPECLDGLYKTNLLKSSSVCIPQRYTSFLAPVSSMRLHTEARGQSYFPSAAADGLDSSPMGPLKSMETPYVVRTHAACQTHAEKACWEFVHPAISTNNGGAASNEKSAHLSFTPDKTQGAGCGAGYGRFESNMAKMAENTQSTGPVTVHGFLGTFRAVLYQSTRLGLMDESLVTSSGSKLTGSKPPIIISSAPHSFSTGMFSWFPLYFPLREPLRVPADATIRVSIWRRVLNHKVWYEWCAEVRSVEGTIVSVTPIHNPNGRSYHACY